MTDEVLEGPSDTPAAVAAGTLGPPASTMPSFAPLIVWFRLAEGVRGCPRGLKEDHARAMPMLPRS